MKCETCRGDGLVVSNDPPSQLDQIMRQRRFVSCMECGGSGFAYCCEGDNESSPVDESGTEQEQT
jgi:hypothetical protein